MTSNLDGIRTQTFDPERFCGAVHKADQQTGETARSRQIAKRLYDGFFSALGLLLLSPVFVLIAMLSKLTDGGSVLYRQTRIGQNGKPFKILKFRTMVPDADKSGPHVTGGGDARITRLGRILRRTKLDELPQLWNVLCGEMSLVGPRPEVARYVERYTAEQRAILRYKPGITDLASLQFRDEEALLQSSADTEEFYLQHCVPRKLKLNQEYAQRANLLSDTWIILQTICPYWTSVVVVYACILSISFWFAQELLVNFELTPSVRRQFVGQAPLVVGLQLLFLLVRRQGKGLLCYFSFPELWQVTFGLIQASMVLMGMIPFAGHVAPSPNLVVLDLLTSFILLCGFRVVLRISRERTEAGETQQITPQTRVGIIGAGSLGAQLARSLNSQRSLGRIVVAFFDDDFGKWQKQIHEVPVVGMPECLLQGWSEKLDEIAVALPNASVDRLRQLDELFEKTKLRVYRLQLPLPELAATK